MQLFPVSFTTSSTYAGNTGPIAPAATAASSFYLFLLVSPLFNLVTISCRVFSCLLHSQLHCPSLLLLICCSIPIARHPKDRAAAMSAGRAASTSHHS